MKDKKQHDHKGTKKLKVILFGIVMLLPLMATLSTTMYVTFNKNAKDSYSTNAKITNKEKIETFTLMESGQYYQIRLQEGTGIGNTRIYYTYSSINFNKYFETITDQKITGILIGTNNINIYNENKQLIYSVYVGNPIYEKIFLENQYLYITFDELNNPTTPMVTDIYKISYSQPTLSEAFYSSTQTTFNQQPFNWVENSILRPTISNFTNAFGLTESDYINNLLTYWTTITCMYLVIDVILETLIYLSHLLFKGKDLND